MHRYHHTLRGQSNFAFGTTHGKTFARRVTVSETPAPRTDDFARVRGGITFTKTNMKEEQINIAIAEACGWRRPDDPEVMKFKVGWTMPEKWWMCPKGVLRFKHDIPNYCNDLNAMHEVVTIKLFSRWVSPRINTPLQAEYEFWLEELVFGNICQAKWPQGRVAAVAHATARQRAEAFLRTLNLWNQ